MRRILAILFLACFPAAAGEPSLQAQYEDLRKEIADIRARMHGRTPVETGPIGRAEALIENKYGPGAPAHTRQGRLTIGGLLQTWFYSIANDNAAWVDGNQSVGGPPATIASNEVWDNDSFRVRRAELRFSIDIHENVTAHVTLDPAREARSFPGLPQNQSSVLSGDGSAFFADADPVSAAGHRFGLDVQNGTGEANRLLQDAYIHYQDFFPHHDAKVGQFKRRLGEEGSRDSGKLDFAERAMITQPAELRDLGLQVHGNWWDDRFQYWVGVFDGAGTAFQQRQNRSDDNDVKDLAGSVLIRPLWRDETWGSLELGYSYLEGIGGESGGRFSLLGSVDGLDRPQTVRRMQYAWGLYRPGGPVKGWWIRGEWGRYQDRFASLEAGAGLPGLVESPAPFNIQGWYVSTGYRLSESIWGEGLRNGGAFAKHVLEPMEFTFRYETMENLFFPDRPNPAREFDVFKSQVFTAGINYYIKGHNAKIQVNYNWAVEEDNRDIDAVAPLDRRQLREVNNHNLIVNLQVSW